MSLKQRPTTLQLTTGGTRRRGRSHFKRLRTPPRHPRPLPKHLSGGLLVFPSPAEHLDTHARHQEEEEEERAPVLTKTAEREEGGPDGAHFTLLTYSSRRIFVRGCIACPGWRWNPRSCPTLAGAQVMGIGFFPLLLRLISTLNNLLIES